MKNKPDRNRKRHTCKRDVKKEKPARRNKKWLLILILILSIAALSPVFQNDYINYDDDWMIYENPYVVDLSISNINDLFSEFYFGQYSPVSMVITGAVYKMGDGNILLLNVFGLLIHIINTLLVFVLMKKLFSDHRLALIGMLFFAIHPVQVETVAWLSAAYKVGVFAMFSFASLIFWEKFVREKKIYQYFAALLLMILACFSKEQAIVLPLFMLIISRIKKEKLLNLRYILKFLPFVLVSLIFVIITILAVASRTEVRLHDYSLPERVYYLSVTFVSYFKLLFYPVNLSLFYGIPEINNVKLIIYPLLTALLIIVIIKTVFKNRVAKWAFLFFFISMILTFTLQLISLRDTIYADRYLYMGVPAFFIMMVTTIESYYKKKIDILIVVTALVFAGASYVRANKFQNSETIWSDAIDKGYNDPLLFNNRGHYYRSQQKTELAIRDYDRALELDPRYFKSLNNRGKIYFDRGKFDIAIIDFNKALSIAPDFISALSNRGAAYAAIQNYDKAFADLDKALSIDPYDKEALRNRALANYSIGKFEDAIIDVDNYLKNNPDDADMLNHRALCYRYLDDNDNALIDLNRAIAIDPSQALFFQNRSYLFASESNYQNALADILHAEKLGLAVDKNYIDGLKTMIEQEK